VLPGGLTRFDRAVRYLLVGAIHALLALLSGVPVRGVGRKSAGPIARRCSTPRGGRQFVVSAYRFNHSRPRTQDPDAVSRSFSAKCLWPILFHNRNAGLWVPAFAGTT